MVATPRRRASRQQPTQTVFYPPDGPDRRQWDVPLEVYRTGMSKEWIEQQLRAERDAEAEVSRRADNALVQEFQTIKEGMGKVSAMREAITVLEQTVESYKAADAAREAELSAVRSAADKAIGVGTNAVATTRDLSLASTQAADLLDRLRTAASAFERQLALAMDQHQAKLEEMQALATQQANTIRNQQRAFQEVVAKLEDRVAELDGTVRSATVAAEDALTTAKAAQRANQHGNDVQTAADSAAAQALQSWETSSDTATMRKLIGTDARSLDHLAQALTSMSNQAQDIGGTSVQDAATIALRLVDRIRQAQEFQDGIGFQYSHEPDTPNGRGGAAKSAAAAGRGRDNPVTY